jgi:Flagellar P-ring protein
MLIRLTVPQGVAKLFAAKGIPKMKIPAHFIGCSVAAGLAMLLVPLMSGCSDNGPRGSSPPVASQDLRSAPIIYPALQGTIAEYAGVAYDTPIIVRGWGIVAGLPNTGSGEMPPEIRQMMVDQMYKEGVGYLSEGTGQYDPNTILSTRQIAAVFVQGEISPLALNGSHFDLYLTALPGTDTVSIANGLLWPADLRVHIEPGSESTAIAQGRGPVFCTPFDASGTRLRAPDAIVRTGEVLGGGVVTQAVPLMLELYNPSYRISAILERTINEHFANGPTPTAVAQSDALITLNVPPAYQDDPAYFVDLVMHLYPQQIVPGFSQSQAQVLIEALRDPEAPHDQIATALSELGRPIISMLRAQYTSVNPDVSFYCIKAGALLGDQEATQMLGDYAEAQHGSFVQEAVKTLELSNDQISATLAFTKLILSQDQNLQLLGFSGLSAINSPSIYTQLIAGSFTMNIIACNAPSIVYATSTQNQRIVIIGRIPSLVPGALYISPDDVLTVNYSPPSATAPVGAAADETPVQLYFDDPLTHSVVQMHCAPQLPDIIAALGSAPNPFSADYDPQAKYIALSYQRMVEMLYSLSQNHLINAQFVLEKAQSNPEQLYTALNSPRIDQSTMANLPAPPVNNNSIPSAPVPTTLPGEINPPVNSGQDNSAWQNPDQNQLGGQDQFNDQDQNQGITQQPQ